MTIPPEEAPPEASAPPTRRRVGAARQRAERLALPFQGLAGRILLSVFGAALVTTVVVAGVSTTSIQAFLRAEIDQKFPAVLRATAERLDLWYAQRRLDIETFARSATVVESVAALRPGARASGAARRAAVERLDQYLSYVLERFPQYQALVVMDGEGAELARVGSETSLPEGLRAGLARVAVSTLGGMHAAPEGRVQVASSPVLDAGGRQLGSVHAVLRAESLVPVLAAEKLGEGGVVYVVDRQGETLFQSAGSLPRAHYGRDLPSAADPLGVADYRSASGEHVVGSALRFARFGWTVVVEEPYGVAFAPVTAVIRRVVAINLGIVVLFGIAAWHLAGSLVRPLKALSEGARRIADGEPDVVVPLGPGPEEIEVLTRAFNEMTQRLRTNQDELEESRQALVRQNEELQRVNEVLEQLSITDELTRLHNHRFFQYHLHREIRRSERTGEPLSLVLVDVDDFKQLNDRYGHAAGDAVLRALAETMNAEVRETDLLARYGGEEFALVASCADLHGARTLGEKLRAAVAEASFPIEGLEPVKVTVSVGVAEYHGDEKRLFLQADRALYEAKGRGKDCVVLADDLPPSSAPAR